MDLKVIGKGYPKLNAKDILTGKTLYVADVAARKEKLYGCIIRSPYARAVVKRIDTQKAEALPGVHAVVVPDDIPYKLFGLFPATFDERVLTDTPLYIGDEIAVAVADDKETVKKAASLVEIEYEVLPPVVTVEESAKDETRIHPERSNFAMDIGVRVGEPEKALEESDYTFSAQYKTNGQHVCAMEPYACLVEWNAEDGLIVYCPTQEPRNTQKHVALLLDLPISKVRVVQTEVGGAFGAKAFHRKLPYICAAAALKTRSTVYIAHDIAEELCVDRPRVPVTIDLTVGADKDGMLLANMTQVTANNGAYSSYGPGPVNVMTTRTNLLYKVPNIQTKSKLLYTDTVPTAGMRGFGNITMLFALECAIDELAEKAGMDPVEFRKKNIYEEGSRTVLGWKINSSRLSECIDSVKKDADRWRAELKEAHRGNKHIGIGIAAGVHVSSNRTKAWDGSCAEAVINEDGSVTLLTGDGDCGQGLRTVLALIGAEVLRIPVERVSVKPVDTSYSPMGLGIFADRGTTISGKAMQIACEDVRDKAMEEGASMFDCPKSELQFESGAVKAPDGRSADLAQIAQHALWRSGGHILKGFANWDPDTIPLDPKANFEGNPSTGYTFCAQALELEVNSDTGEIKILKIAAAHDSGTIINPLIARGQIQGAITQGIGYALLESVKIGENGEVLNGTLRSYKLPTYMDLPGELKIDFIESYEESGPFGAKGIGQTGTLLVAPCIANALHDAVGIRMREIPMTPEKVYRAIKEQGGCRE